ncbi:Uncharacterised protein [uncultured archaeon]|nr:Uncharacterised protein [uncultured archaeon]
MKKFFTVFLMLFPWVVYGQQINLGPSNIQVKGVLQQVNGGTGSNTAIPSCENSNQALTWVGSTTGYFGCNTFAISSGTVTTVSGNSNTLFSVSVANPTTTPAFTYTLLDTVNQIFVGTASATGSWKTLPSCSGSASALTYNST